MAQSVSRALEQIPGVGENIAQDMRNIDISSIDDLKGKKAEDLYQKLCDFKASPVDRCVLYVFRSAIYYAENTQHDPRAVLRNTQPSFKDLKKSSPAKWYVLSGPS